MIRLVPYQEDAVNGLVDAFRQLLRTDYPTTQVVFKSPTGSGKTLMTAEALKRLALEDLPTQYVYVWASMNKLHIQSKAKLADYLRDSRYNLISLEELADDALTADTILFANWESMIKTDRKTGEWSNRAVRQGESQRNIIDILSATRAQGREVILIVDEAHQTYLGPKSQLLVSTVIRPKLTLEVSATPLLKPSGEDVTDNKARIVKVPFHEVVASGLIKQETRINYEIEPHLGEHPSDEAVVEAALQRREVLKKLYKKAGSDVMPLVLIQLPTEDSDKTSVLDQTVRARLEAYLATVGITYDSGRLAIWLSEEKRNKEGIEAHDSLAEVLIFKKAIATGWDCQRAQILVMLHDMKSEVFKIQTVGRILRMPEAHHYDHPDLNAAYVYTNLGSIVIDPEGQDAGGFFMIKNARWRQGLKNVALPSVYTHRTDFHDLTAAFRPILFKYLDGFFKLQKTDSKKVRRQKLDAVLELSPEELQKPILADVTVQNLDEIDQATVQTLEATLDSAQVEHLFQYALKGWTSPYNFVRSVERLKPALYDWFAAQGYGRDRIDEIQRIVVCSAGNQNIFSAIIGNAKQEFEQTRHAHTAEKRAVTELTFRVPEIDQYGDNYTLTPSAKHALEPYYAAINRPATEARFEQLLEASQNVDWWYKNGEKMQQYFAIPFMGVTAAGVRAPASFYPDYIVRYHDGRVGIYDTKAGITLASPDTTLKAVALQHYIAKQIKGGLKLVGGIVDIRSDGTAWLCTDKDYAADDRSKWELFV
jgi:type III restriction enzyme